MARLINAEVMGFFATPRNVTAQVAAWLSAPQDGLWRLLDPCCGEGVAASDLAASLGSRVQTWGAELSPKRAERAAAVLHKVHNAAWQDTRVSKESVSLLWLNPPYDSDLDGRDKRLEIEFLRTTLNTLVIGGILVYLVPQHLLGYRDAARLLAGHFSNLSVVRFPDGEYERFKQVIVFARRKVYANPTSEDIEALRELRNTELPPLAEAVAPWPLPIPNAPANASFNRINRSDKETVALGFAQGWPAALLESIRPQEAQQPFHPPLPPKKGHIAMLMASGLMGKLRLSKNGANTIVKGRVLKKQDVFEEEDDKGQTITIRKDRFVTTVGVTDADGVRVVDDVEGLTAFMEEYAEELAVEILKHQPQYNFKPTAAEWEHMSALGKQRQPLPGQAEAGLLATQKHVGIALTRALKREPNALLQGEMGFGKTTVGLAVIDALNAYPAIVIGPPHLVEKWQREAVEVIPGVQVRELRRLKRDGDSDVNDARQFIEDWQAGRLGDKAIAVISETSAKLGSGWHGAPSIRHGLPRLRDGESDQNWPMWNNFQKAAKAYEEARAELLRLRKNGDDAAALAEQRAKVARLRKAALGKTVEYTVCPDCGKMPADAGGVLQTRAAFDKKPCHCSCATTGWARDEQGQRVFDEEGHPVWVWDTKNPLAPRCGSALYEFGDKFRRWPIADYIRKKADGVFKMLVADEVHQFRGKDSDRGQAFHHLVGATQYHLGMTGTIYGGKSTSVFYLFYRLFSKVRQDFPFNGEKLWAQRYGVLETRQYGKGDAEATNFGSFNATRRGKTTVTELPGVSPAILSQIFDTSLFVSLKDLGATLPPYKEEAVRISMSPEQGAQYHSMNSYLTALARQHPSYLSTWLQWSLGRPNSAFRDETVVKKERDDEGNVTSTTRVMDLPAIVAGADAVGVNEDGDPIYAANGDEPLPKEEWLVNYVKAEKAAGRKVLVFARQTGTRDIQPRIKAVLENAGLRAIVLSSGVETRKREAWIRDRVDARTDVMICNPKLVETGLDLVQFATVVFFEMDYDLFTLWQAMRRVWRLGQRQSVKVLFTSYIGTMEETALQLMGMKMKAAQLLYGDEVGGAIVPESGENFLTELARGILEGQELPDLKTLFAEAAAVSNSPLGSPTATSPRMTPVTLEQVAALQALYEAELRRRQEKAAARRKKQPAGPVQVLLGENGAEVQQLGLF